MNISASRCPSRSGGDLPPVPMFDSRLIQDAQPPCTRAASDRDRCATEQEDENKDGAAKWSSLRACPTPDTALCMDTMNAPFNAFVRHPVARERKPQADGAVPKAHAYCSYADLEALGSEPLEQRSAPGGAFHPEHALGLPASSSEEDPTGPAGLHLRLTKSFFGSLRHGVGPGMRYNAALSVGQPKHSGASPKTRRVWQNT